jgi:hypothetical protein
MWSSAASSDVGRSFRAGFGRSFRAGFDRSFRAGVASLAAVLLHALAASWLLLSAAVPAYFPDDPLWRDDDKALDASGAGEIEDSNGYDFVVNTFVQPGERRDIRAPNVNTVDDVPDSSWFTNRIGRMPMTVEEIVRGPDLRGPMSLDGWVITQGKSAGVQPGFRMINPADGPNGHLYQIEFDPPSNPEMATGAEIIGTAFYHAFGYHTVEVYLAELDPAKIVIAPDARINDPLIGAKRPLTRLDVDKVLRRGARRPDGKYRVLASRFASGRPLGNFRYYGTRPDDPNDVVPHEHRRELRAARVFGAWLNHDDSRGVNSLDMLETENGRGWVKHYMFDFGSIMGSGTVFAQRHRAGNEYILEWAPGWLTLATLGIYTRPWLHYTYPEVPSSVGRFEGDFFDPLLWKPEYPNPAFRNMRGDDAFWAARIVSKFSDAAIRAVVEKARYTDPRATAYITETLIKRRDKVLRAWLAGINPLTDFSLSAAGELAFANAAVEARAATSAREYRVSWARFDNATGASADVGGQIATTTMGAQLPAALASAEFVEARIAALHADHPAWATPVVVHFRRGDGGWTVVGVRRQPEPLPTR